MLPHLEQTAGLFIVVMTVDVYVRTLVKITKRKTLSKYPLFGPSRIYLHAIKVELTFAGPYTLRPPVIHVSIAGTSAVLKPSTARSAATSSAGFLEHAALCAHHRFGG